MTEVIKKLAEKVNWKDPDSIIQFHEKYENDLSNFKPIEDEETILFLINIKCHYVNSLIGKSRFSKAKAFITDIDILNQKIKNNQELFKKYEEEKDFFLGLVYGHLKNYSESANIFKRLISVDPENDNYINWYIDMKTKSVYKQTMALGIIGLIIVVGEIALKSLFHIYLPDYVFIVGLTLILISTLFPYIYKYWIRTKIVWK